MSLQPTILSSNSRSHINNLDDNLLIEILTRIPCQSALRCTVVCKRWCTIISTPYFTIQSTVRHRHQEGYPKTSTLVFRFEYFHCYMQEGDDARFYQRTYAISNHPAINSRGSNLLEFNIGFPWLNFGWTSLVAGCGDLLVLRDDAAFPSVYFICNPLTRKWVKLPPAAEFHTEDGTAVGMVVDRGSGEEGSESECNAMYRYRVVCITELAGTQVPVKINVETFSSDTGEWRSKYVELPSSGGSGGSHYKGTVIVAFERKLHWLRGQAIIVSDPFDDTCITIGLPAGVTSRIPLNCLGVCNNHLRVSRVTREEAASKLMVWELLDDGDTREWQLKYRICLKDMVFVSEDSYKRLTFSSEVVAFHPNDGDIVYLKDHDQLIICDMKSRMLEVVNEGAVEPSIHIRRILLFPLVHPWWPTSVLPLPLPVAGGAISS